MLYQTLNSTYYKITYYYIQILFSIFLQANDLNLFLIFAYSIKYKQFQQNFDLG